MYDGKITTVRTKAEPTPPKIEAKKPRLFGRGLEQASSVDSRCQTVKPRSWERSGRVAAGKVPVGIGSDFYSPLASPDARMAKPTLLKRGVGEYKNEGPERAFLRRADFNVRIGIFR